LGQMCYNSVIRESGWLFYINITLLEVYHRVQISLCAFLLLHFASLADAVVLWHQWLFCNQFLCRNPHAYQDPRAYCSITADDQAYRYTHPGSDPNGGPYLGGFAHATS